MEPDRDAEFAAAEAAGARVLAEGPRAVAARFDPQDGRVVVDLASGCSFAFPPELVQGLAGASPEALGHVTVEGLGLSLHWPDLDADLWVPGLLAGVFGTQGWMAREAARQAGRRTSPAKAAAARANGAKGGRPRKSA
jgi:hypothetical protein